MIFFPSNFDVTLLLPPTSSPCARLMKLSYFLRVTTPRMDLVTHLRPACSGQKSFKIFCLILFVGPSSFLYIVHGESFIKILRRQCNRNIDDLRPLSKWWRRAKLARIIFDRRCGGQTMPGTIFDEIRYKHNNVFFSFSHFFKSKWLSLWFRIVHQIFLQLTLYINDLFHYPD